jgi:hypothetical protein
VIYILLGSITLQGAIMIEQKPEAKVPAKKMKKYGSAGKGPSTSGNFHEVPSKDLSFSNESSGSMNYLAKQDEMLSSDAAKVRRGEYKPSRYK